MGVWHEPDVRPEFAGSSDFWWGGGVEAAGDEEHAEAVVVGVAVAAGDAAVELDDPVDRFGAAVAGAGGGEVGQEGLFWAVSRILDRSSGLITLRRVSRCDGR